MARVVFILGAGASRQAGGPLMTDFLDIANDLWMSNKVGDKALHFERVFKAIGALQAVHSKADLDLTNIESIFATLEIAKILEKFPGSTLEEIDEIIASLKELILVTLEQTIRFPFVEKDINPPDPYNDFVGLLNYLTKEAKPRQTVAVITFNYDVAIDYALDFNLIDFNYCLPNSPTKGIPLLKLHGSLNWAFCSICKAVVSWQLRDYRANLEYIFPKEKKYTILEIGSNLGSFPHCDKPVLPQPVLVPPTWNKTEHHQAISTVWSRAARELEEAEHIFIIGYSLPPTDAFFRLLYALGTVGEKTLRRIWVYNPYEGPEVDDRFKSMLGPGARARYCYRRLNFFQAITEIKEKFQNRE